MLKIRRQNIRDKKKRLRFFLNDFSLYSNAPRLSDSMKAWALGRISFTAVMI